MRRAVRWLAAVLLVASYLLATVGRAEATAMATTTNPANKLSATALYSPSAPSAVPLGHTASVTWTASSPQNGNGYVVSGTNVGAATASCPTTLGSYAFVGAVAGTSFTDVTPMAGGTDGTYVCYLLRSAFGTTAPATWGTDPVWTSANTLPTTKTAIGFFSTSVTLTNGGTAGRLDPGDTIVIQFDQAVNTASVSVTQICAAVATTTVYLGSSHGTATCNAGSTVGTLTGINLSSAASKDGAFNATAAWTNANRTLTITVGASVMGATIRVGAGTTTYTPAALSSASGAAAICTTAICKPTTATAP